MYSVEAEFIDRVVAEYGPCEFVQFDSIFPSPCPPFLRSQFPVQFIFTFGYSLYLTCSIRSATKVGAIVAGQTSVKAPEKAAFEKYLPEDVHIVSCHSLHGPTVSPLGQPLVSKPPLIWLTCLMHEMKSHRSSSNIGLHIHRSSSWRIYCGVSAPATCIFPTKTTIS
jgi:hypothetical protein